MLRVAIVGLGPKGLFALERLLDHASTLDGDARIDVDVFENHPVAGAGPIYDPGQPSYLRMNFAAGALDMWWPTSSTVPRGERRAFVAWSDVPGGCDAGDYPARAEVGRYLADGLATILRHAPATVRVTLRRTRATAIRPHGERWDVVAGGVVRTYAEVLLAVGHELTSTGGLAEAWHHPAVLVPSVFPVRTWLCAKRIAPGAVVAVRGFALTFIDAALALTEGRGGTFETLDHPCRLRYVPGDEDVRAILPFSRTGRAMLPKPDLAVAAGAPAAALARIAEHGSSRVRGLADGFDLRRDLLAILAATAAGALLAVRGPRARQGDDRVALERWLANATTGIADAGEPTPARTLERSLAVAVGLRAPDATWALGHVWRTLYPALVSRLGDGGLAQSDWPAFRRLAAEMERVAFGPSPSNVAKLLALAEAGRIDLTYVRGGELASHRDRTFLCRGDRRHPIDAVIDAVLPAPGIRDVRGEPLRGLLAEGHVRVAPGRRGLDVAADGGCRSLGGSPSDGLSAIGRATEDVVIGNDTLSRALHPLADRWARRIIRRCRDDARPADRELPRAEIR